MFGKNRAIELRMVNTKNKKQSDEDLIENIPLNPEQLNELAKDFVNHTSMVVTNACITLMVVGAICKIAVVATKALAR